jgi:DNA-binding transcriptional LysR family regulator
MELGVPLFNRVGKRIVLNEYGRILLRHTQCILDNLDNIKKEIQFAANTADNTIRLSLMAASQLLPEILQMFKNEYPKSRFLIHQEPSTSSEEDSDLTLYASIHSVGPDNTVNLLTEEIMVGVPHGHRLAQCNQISLHELEGESFIGLDYGMGLSNIMKEYCSLINFEQSIDISCDSPATLRNLIKLNIGIAFIPSVTWQNHSSDMHLLHISDFDCKRYLMLKWHANKYMNPACVAFKEFLIDYFSQKNNCTP